MGRYCLFIVRIVGYPDSVRSRKKNVFFEALASTQSEARSVKSTLALPRKSRPFARLVLEERVADDRLAGMLVPNVTLHIELLFAKFAAVGALEARRLAAVVLEVSRDGALRAVALPAARTRVAGPRLPRASTRVGVLEPRQR